MNKIFSFIILINIVILCSCVRKKEQHLYLIKQNGKYGFIDSSGTVKINPQYLFAHDFQNGLALVVVDTNKKIRYGFINSENKFIIKPNLLYFKINRNFLESDKSNSNKDLIPKDFLFYDSLAMFLDTLSNNIGYIDKTGDVIIKPIYNEAKHFSNCLAAVYIISDTTHISDKYPEYHRKWGYINKTGQVVIEPKYTDADEFHEGYASVGLTYSNKAESEFSFETLIINKKGIIIGRPLSMTNFYGFNEGFGIIYNWGGWVGGKFAFIDKQQNMKTGWLDDVTYFKYGLAGVKIDGKWGYINKEFKFFIAPQFDAVKPFQSGLAAVKKGSLWGYIDTLGNLKIPYTYDNCSNFTYKLAKFNITKNELTIDGYINKKGIVVWQNEEIKK